jgi:hypothetical protein
VSQAPKHWSDWSGYGFRFFPRDRIGGGEKIHPVAENGFFRAARSDALAAGMCDAAGGLVEEQRLCRVGAIDERLQAETEVIKAIRGRAGVWKVKSRTRGHSVRIVATLASSLLKGRVNGCGEIVLVYCEQWTREGTQERDVGDGMCFHAANLMILSNFVAYGKVYRWRITPAEQ